ncbi:protein RRP5 homolog [Trichonephila clavata]|uniref:Protein RRP5 homolog n=1 Tax=Trichonephila clavata TaxID=2740835 RepID=A0A8X6JD61_TRICU|nr:protein RRP5 homolog [Trichonephila clavata]
MFLQVAFVQPQNAFRPFLISIDQCLLPNTCDVLELWPWENIKQFLKVKRESSQIFRMKRTLGIKLNPGKRKKQKISETEPETSKRVKAEMLDLQTLREGMGLLGCVIQISSNYLLMSLPGCLVGRVSVTNISAKYTELITDSIADESDNISEVSLDSILDLGAMLPCKVLSISFEDSKKPYIELSINPQDVNKELKLSSLYHKMVLHAAVQSVEDHGYVMDVGIKGTQGFLPFRACTGQKNVTVGQVLPTLVRKLPSEKNGNVVWLSELSFNEPFPEVEKEGLNLISILPGTNVIAYITEIKNRFLYANCMDFDACANTMTMRNAKKNLTEGDKVCGTVLYVHPITRMIYLHLGAKPSPNSFKNFFRVKKYALVKNVRFEYSSQRKLFFKFHHTMGFIKQNEVKQDEFSLESLSQNPVIPMARVMTFHYMDNLVHLSFIKAMLELQIVRAEDVQVGDIFEVTVKNHSSFGMFVKVCLGLKGFVQKCHISDAFVTMPEKLYPVGTRVKCRVLSVKSQWLNLTCKKSLLNLPPEGILKSYEEALVNGMYKGVIAQKTDNYLLIIFFNNVKGIVSTDYIPETSVYFVGQTITCYVLFCDPVSKKLKLSLTDKHSTQKISNVQKKASKQLKSKIETNSILKGMEPEKASKQMKSKIQTYSMLEGIEPKKLFRALITSKSPHQLNITLESGFNGRIHITELGSTEENILPLNKFSTGMYLNVHIIGITSKKSLNFLAITNRKMRKVLECSLEYPPPIPFDKTFYPGMSVNGFVKEVGDVSAALWLSPSQIGTLDYINVSNNPKILRRLKKEFKVGLSLTCNILEVDKKSGKIYSISLSKREKEPIEAGCNIVGLVQISTPEKGLIMKLPNNYHGVVCLTDLQDVFSPFTNAAKYRKQQFILCHVLEVNHATKFCQLSLRKTRLYNHPKDSLKDYQPELTVKDLKKGKVVKGFIKIVGDNQLIVSIGRMLEGVASLHKCSVNDCSSCQTSQDILQKFSVGDVLDVVIEGVTAKENLYPVSLHHLSNSSPNQLRKNSDSLDVVKRRVNAKKPQPVHHLSNASPNQLRKNSDSLDVNAKETQPVHHLSNAEISQCERLRITEDIDWNEF